MATIPAMPGYRTRLTGFPGVSRGPESATLRASFLLPHSPAKQPQRKTAALGTHMQAALRNHHRQARRQGQYDPRHSIAKLPGLRYVPVSLRHLANGPVNQSPAVVGLSELGVEADGLVEVL